MPLVRQTFRAMATGFEIVLLGDDDEHLAAVAAAIADEVWRVERLLSRFDPASEISRINRDAARITLKLDRELVQVLAECRDGWQRSAGLFAVVQREESSRVGWEEVDFDEETGTIRLRDPRLSFDLGAYGKGYALDRAAELLARYGIEDAFLHGGTSSAIARGRSSTGEPWRVALGPKANLMVELHNAALSTSASSAQGEELADIIDPSTCQPLVGESQCSVIAGTASSAEIASTSLLLRGSGNLPLENWPIRNAYWFDNVRLQASWGT
ncbi:MAG TPA: FAD:protein FMN transferase [Pirellulaceae bacterium]|nr:FAD:protein FMN transferase [Pirellulaceae bacterium]